MLPQRELLESSPLCLPFSAPTDEADPVRRLSSTAAVGSGARGGSPISLERFALQGSFDFGLDPQNERATLEPRR